MNSSFPASNNPIKLYRYEMSGHCHRVQLMMSLLEIPYQTIDIERDGSNQPEDFLSISPMGQVPVIDDNGFKLADSNGILIYLVKKYSPNSNWLPDDVEMAGKIQRWLSIVSGELVSGPAIARFSKIYNVVIDYETVKKKSLALLSMLDSSLKDSDFVTGNTLNIADIALYTYVAHAPEGGIKLDSFPNIIKWIKNIESLEHFVPLKVSQIT